MEGMHRLVVV